MITTLYPLFRGWSAKGSIWIYSDPHFEDSDCQYMDANWPTPEEQVKTINSYAHKNDTLIILGDIGNVEWVKKLKAGYKVLITGNHDSGAENYIQIFDEVYTGPLMIAEKMILSHEPIPNLTWALNIHGHQHNKYVPNDTYHFNVCSNTINFRPINLKDIINSGRLKEIDSLHRITIDNATERKEAKRNA